MLTQSFIMEEFKLKILNFLATSVQSGKFLETLTNCSDKLLYFFISKFYDKIIFTYRGQTNSTNDPIRGLVTVSADLWTHPLL